MKTKSIFAAVTAAAATVAVLSLSACGGGGDDAPAVTTSVPATASASSGGFTDYLMALVNSVNTDDYLPVDLSGVTSPPEDNDSPPKTLAAM